MPIIIKEQDFCDLPACAEVIHRGFAETAERNGFTVENNPTHGAFVTTERLMSEKTNGVILFCALLDGERMGFFGLDLRENTAILEKLTVIPQHRHNGYGTQMVEYAKTFAASKGKAALTAGIIGTDERLWEWYKRNGFVIEEERNFPHLSFPVKLIKCNL